MHPKPNELSKLVEAKTKGVNAAVDQILDNVDSPEAKVYQKCKEISKSPLQKQYIEACLLGSEDEQEICTVLEYPIEVVRAYRAFFYNVVGWNRLEKLDLINSSKLEPDEQALKLWALNQGLLFVSWRLGHKVTINPLEGLNELFSIAVYKAKEALFTGNASESSKEAAKWTKQSLDLARLLKLWSLDSNAAKKDLELAIKEVVPEFRSISELMDEARQAETDELVRQLKEDQEEADGNNN